MKKSVFACLLAGLFVFGLFTSCKGIQDIYAKAGCSLVFTLPGGSNSRAVEKSKDEYITHYDVCVRDRSDKNNNWDALLFAKNKVKAGDTVRVKGLKPDMKVLVKVLPYAKSENGTFILMNDEWAESAPVEIKEDEPAVATIKISKKDLIEPKYEIPEGNLGASDTPIKNVNELKDAIAAVKTKDFPTRLFLADNSTFTYDGYEIGENNKGYGIYVTGNVELYQEAKAITSVPAITFEQKGNSTFFYVENGASLKIKNNGYCKINFDSSAVCNVTNNFTANCPFFEVRGNGVLELDGVEVNQTHRISFITSAKTGKAIINNCKFNVVDYGRTEYQPVIELNDKAILEISNSTISNCKKTSAILAEHSANIYADGLSFESCNPYYGYVPNTSENILRTSFNSLCGIIKINQTTEYNLDPSLPAYSLPGHFEFKDTVFDSCEGEEILTGTDIYLGGDSNKIHSIFMFEKLYDEHDCDGYCSYPRIYLKSSFKPNTAMDPTVVLFPSYFLIDNCLYKLTSGYIADAYSNKYYSEEMILMEDGSRVPDDADFVLTDAFVNYKNEDRNNKLELCNNGIFCKKFGPSNYAKDYEKEHRNFIIENMTVNGTEATISSSTVQINDLGGVSFYGSSKNGSKLIWNKTFPAFRIAAKNINNEYDVVFDGSYGPIEIVGVGSTENEDETIFDLTSDGIYYSSSSRVLFKNVKLDAQNCHGIRLDDHHVPSNASTITGNFVRIQNCEINVDKGYYPVLITGKRCTVALSGETVPDVYVNGTEANVILESSPKNVNIKVDGTRFVLVANKTEYTQLTTVKIILPNNYAEMYSGDNKQIVECSGIANVKNVLNVEVYDNDGNAIPYNNETGELIIE